MRTLSIKSLIEFRGKGETGKRNFAAALRLNEPMAVESGGGNYWISSLSAISQSFRTKDLQPIVDRMSDLEDRHEDAIRDQTRTMYNRNIDILYKYEDLDLNRWRPARQLSFLRKDRVNSVLTIRGLPVLAAPHHVYTFGRNEPKEIGGIWFVAKLDGLSKVELGMFTDVLYRYMKMNYSGEHTLSKKYCIAVDVVNNYDLSYAQLEKGEAPSILNATLDEVKSFM
jgi:hypothetical protein